MQGAIGFLVTLHHRFFAALESLLTGWFTGLAARFVFASLLFLYYVNSGWGKLGDGPFGFLSPNSGAFVTIFPKAMEAVSYDHTQLSFFPYHLVVYFGTWAEIVLPFLVVIGLFTRLSALGMIFFVVVQSIVDVFGHGLDDKSVGAMFDRLPDAIIWDQRLAWVFLLLIVVVHGAGRFSIDHLLARSRAG
ncbi:MAG: DoxX family protein [Rhizobiaceae bacterium]